MKNYIAFIIFVLFTLMTSCSSSSKQKQQTSVSFDMEEEYIDLGLSVKWATKNIGAKSPDEYGNYYAWGETSPKDTYTKDNCLWGEYTPKELYNQGNVYNYEGFLSANADAARFVLGGEHWRMPNLGEIRELLSKCSFETIGTSNGNVIKVTGPNGNHIFIPCAGIIDGNGKSVNNAAFWSADVIDLKESADTYNIRMEESASSYFGAIETNGSTMASAISRHYGLPIRPVWDEYGVPIDSDFDFAEDDTCDDDEYDDNLGGYTYIEPKRTMQHEYVDLGLPSGLKWATCNIGTNIDYLFGFCFQWGKLSPIKDSFVSLAEYFPEFKEMTTGNKGDAATYYWGEQWRTPSSADFEELINNCKWEFCYRDELPGYKVIGPNGKSIFLPSKHPLKQGPYWTTNYVDDDENYAYVFVFLKSKDILRVQNNERWNKCAIRPVYDENLKANKRAQLNVVTYDACKSVDLGLPSGVEWATCNLGASSPEDDGGYYAWGEVELKDSYLLENYKWKGETDLNKLLDANGNLRPENDAATVNLGSEWSTPTNKDWQELQDNCTWTWSNYNGVKGYVVKGRNDNSIFLPAVGFTETSTNITYIAARRTHGWYWSASQMEKGRCAGTLTFQSSFKVSSMYSETYSGLSIRPIKRQNR